MKVSGKLPQYKPKDNEPCLCGSGEAFGDCCGGRLPGTAIDKQMEEAWSRGDYEEALQRARASLCQYAIWHKSHTAPIVAIDKPAIAELLSVDIEAMASLVDDVCTLYYRLKRQEQLPAVLERLRALINDARWQRKLTSIQAVIADTSGDEDGARREFAKLLPITPEEMDVEVIQVYLDIYAGDIAFADRIELCNRIIRLSPKVSDHLQYGGMKGFAYLGIGDLDTGRKELAAAIAYAHLGARERPLSSRSKLLLAGVLSVLGVVTEEERRLVEAEGLYKEMLADKDQFSAEGQAKVFGDLGECYRYGGKWREAEDAYRQSLAALPRPISSVFLAECVLKLGRQEEAAAIIDQIDFAALKDSEQVDYAYVLAEQAVATASKDRLQAALAVLRKVKTDAPFFEQRRLEFMLAVQETIAKDAEAGAWTGLRKLLAQPLRFLNRYALLQPNWNGVGLNLNAMIEDALGSDERKPKSADHGAVRRGSPSR